MRLLHIYFSLIQKCFLRHLMLPLASWYAFIYSQILVSLMGRSFPSHQTRQHISLARSLPRILHSAAITEAINNVVISIQEDDFHKNCTCLLGIVAYIHRFSTANELSCTIMQPDALGRVRHCIAASLINYRIVIKKQGP